MQRRKPRPLPAGLDASDPKAQADEGVARRPCYLHLITLEQRHPLRPGREIVDRLDLKPLLQHNLRWSAGRQNRGQIILNNGSGGDCAAAGIVVQVAYSDYIDFHVKSGYHLGIHHDPLNHRPEFGKSGQVVPIRPAHPLTSH